MIFTSSCTITVISSRTRARHDSTQKAPRSRRVRRKLQVPPKKRRRKKIRLIMKFELFLDIAR